MISNRPKEKTMCESFRKQAEIQTFGQYKMWCRTEVWSAPTEEKACKKRSEEMREGSTQCCVPCNS